MSVSNFIKLDKMYDMILQISLPTYNWPWGQLINKPQYDVPVKVRRDFPRWFYKKGWEGWVIEAFFKSLGVFNWEESRGQDMAATEEYYWTATSLV